MAKDDKRSGLSGWILGAPRKTATDGSGRSIPRGDIHKDEVIGRRTLGGTRRGNGRHVRRNTK